MLAPGASSQPPPLPAAAMRAVDLLGDLPSEVLDKILAVLPAEDMVRTSVLSQPWRRRWESVPGLDIELDDVDVRDDDAARAWWGSAGRFLERCAGPVGRVSIRGVPLRLCHRADDWVRAVAGKRPRSLSLALPKSTLLPSLFLCDPDALGELELYCCTIPAPPAGFEGFHKLTKLDLDDVLFTGGHAFGQLQAMISAAVPTLVELRLQNVAFIPDDGDDGSGVPDGWVIQAPNLRRLVLCLWIAEAGRVLELGPFPKLEMARIFLNDPDENIDYVQMFKAISNVKELHLGNFRVDTQAAAINIFQNLLWRFKNLRILRLDGTFDEAPANQLFRLSPFLETIEIKEWY